MLSGVLNALLKPCRRRVIEQGVTFWRAFLILWVLVPMGTHMHAIASAANCISVESSNGMVVAGHPEAARIGADILASGGNALDAAVATGFALSVAELYGSGIGGKCAIVYYDAITGKTAYIDGLDEAGEFIDVAAFAALDAPLRREGVLGVGVPGMVAAMDLAHRNWGRLPWKDLITPSVRLAEEGFTVVAGMPVFFERRLARIESDPECRRIYLPDGLLPKVGERLRNPDLAWTLEQIALKGRDGFYDGKVAALIVDALRAGGSHLRLEDFRNYQARISEPLVIEWLEYEIAAGGCPTTGGATALLTLEVLKALPLDRSVPLRSAQNLSLWAHALRELYPLIQAGLADTADYAASWADLTREASISRVRRAVEQSIPSDSLEPVSSGSAADSWTTHFVVVDKRGNVASVTQSLSHHFGSGVIAPGTGCVLNNSLKNFSFSDPDAVNYVAGGKRPRSTIAPAIVLRNGRPVVALGLPGGGRIPTTISSILLDHLAFGRDLGEAIADSRFHLLRSWSKEPVSNTFQLEATFDVSIADALDELGWQVEFIEDTEFFGGVTAVEICDGGILRGWADGRRTNAAMAPEAGNE
jgi:gamma-glutamyltranspeptidase/glutathione hydrolase